jgi:hypothetical protein
MAKAKQPKMPDPSARTVMRTDRQSKKHQREVSKTTATHQTKSAAASATANLRKAKPMRKPRA